MNFQERLATAERAHRAGDLPTAVRAYREAAERDPRQPAPYFLAGIACYQLREYEAAITLFRNTVHLAPHFDGGHYNLGTVLQEVGQFEEAIRCFRRALKINPLMAESWVNLGTALLATGDSLTAIHALSKAANQVARTPEARFNRAFAYLLRGEFKQGLADWEHRWSAPVFRSQYFRNYPQPQWDGRLLTFERLLVWGEQGYGDTIQMMRYWPQIKAKASFITLEVQEPLRRLYAQQGIATVSPDESPARFECHIPNMSLPFLFGLEREEQIPPPIGLPGPSAKLGTPAPNVGLCWAGTKMHRNDARRSIPTAQLAALFAVPGISWHILQIERLDELEHVPSSAAVRTYHKAINDFADTAALIRSMDLVITVDTAIAHLAATIGVPTWILLSAWPDWRWMAHREDSPWYPSARLYRQRDVTSWQDVLLKVSTDLAAFHPARLHAASA